VGVNNAFVRMIILIGEQNRPITIQRCRIDSISMILGRYKAATSVSVSAGLVETSITIPEQWTQRFNTHYHTTIQLTLPHLSALHRICILLSYTSALPYLSTHSHTSPFPWVLNF